MADSKRNSDRRVEGEEGAHQEGLNSVQAGHTQRQSNSAPEQIPNDDERTFGDNSVGEEEPGPYDDDGLPENARRRVPS